MRNMRVIVTSLSRYQRDEVHIVDLGRDMFSAYAAGERAVKLLAKRGISLENRRYTCTPVREET